jgi:tetratricopeptide (TPR) repeat protein
MGNTDNARSLFEKGIKLAPMHVPLYQSWASTELRNGNFLAAKALISQALTRDKRNGEGWLIAAEIEQRMGNHGLGSLLLRRGIECAPANARLYRALGDSLVGQGKINEAREIFEKGMEVDPMHAPLYHSLAELEARVFNVEGLAILNKRAAEVFNANALEPSSSSSEVLGSKIRAGRIRDIPKDVAALAQRIVEDDASDLTSNDSDTNAFLESLVGSNLLEVCLSSSLLDIPEQGPN